MKNCFKEGAITPEFIAESIAHHQVKTNIGAHQIFLGQVRNDIIDNKEVVAIDYSAHEEMANKMFHTIRENTFDKFSNFLYELPKYEQKKILNSNLYLC